LAAAWFVIDETVGLALASPGAPGPVLFRAGVACYGAWVLGTGLGVAGGAVVGVEGLAAAVFPVLFVGLASIMARGTGPVVRTVLAAGLTLVLLLAWPGLGGLAPVIAAIAVSLVGRPDS
jgi:predicted branched-subunit amino acid permease